MSQGNSIKIRAISGAIWKFMERLGAQMVSMIVAIVLARRLSPDDYSVVGIVSVFFTFANVFISGGFNTALIQKKDADSEDYSSVLFISVSTALLLYAVLFACAPVIAWLYEKPILIPVIRVMGLTLPVSALKSIVCAYISAHLMFRKFFFATLGGTLVSATVGIAMAYAGFGAWALVAQQMLNTTIDTLILWLSTRMPLVMKVSVHRLKRLLSYGWKIFASSMLAAVYTEINPLFIGLKYTGADLAFYAKGRNFPSLISSICNSTFSSVLFPVLAKVQDDRAELLRVMRRFISTASFFIFPAMLGFWAISDNFVKLVLTEKWLPAAQYIRIFCIGELFVSICSGNCEAIKAMGRSDLFFWMEIIKKTCYFIIIGVAMVLTDSPVALAYSAIGCTAVAVIVNAAPNIRLLDYRLRDQIADVLPNLICAAAMCAFIRLIRIEALPIALEMLVQILIGGMSYVCFGLLTRNRNLTYVWRNARALLNR